MNPERFRWSRGGSRRGPSTSSGLILRQAQDRAFSLSTEDRAVRALTLPSLTRWAPPSPLEGEGVSARARC